MARGINKVILVGNLGADPEVRMTPGNLQIVRANIATSSGWKDKQTGEMQEKTEWHRVVFFNRLGEIAAQYLRKGAKVYIEGSLRTSKYTDKNGVEKFSTEIVANEMQMLDSRGGQSPDNQYEHASAAPAHSSASSSSSSASQNNNDFDDDIPF
ncbi:MAG: single-stranded DNA-binding protein [Gammaproteobacteria bacterium]|nr:single-stranded DNA-binding protein [Gammaproteobacteria bacterium]